ncbi:putative nucleotidyltransferase, ribonuclease H [Tanacetum coccineum]
MHNQFSQILATLEKSCTQTPEPKALTLAITTSSGITTRDPLYLNQPSSAPKVINETAAKEGVPTEKENLNTPNLETPLSSTLHHPSKSSNIPFLFQLRKQKKDDEQEKFLSIFKHININLPFLEALNQMPKGAKVLKDLLSNKAKLENVASSITLGEECSAAIQKNLPQKKGDPRSFTLPCLIRTIPVKNALAYLGASINLMPYSFFLKLGIAELKPTKMSIQLVDRSIKYPIGICENLLVKINKFIFSVNFVILEIDEDASVLIILGQPFLTISCAVIDVHDGKLSLRAGKERVIFNIGKSMKFASSQDDYLYIVDHTYEMVQEQLADTLYPDRNWIDNEEEDKAEEVQAISFYPRKGPIKPLEWKILENRLKLSVDIPPKVELKALLNHLEYAFLPGDDQLLVVISSILFAIEKGKLLKVLRSYKKAIAWGISDIKGIDPSFCTYKILMEEVYKPCVQPQRRLNPNMKEVIKKEVIKPMDAGIIYPIYDSPWMSQVQVVPKKGGMTVVRNEKNEFIPQRIVIGWRVCIDYRKLNDATKKDHFPLPFIDQMLKRLAGHDHYCFLNGFSGYFQILIALEDQEKTTFTCPYGTFAYHRMPFGLCNAPATFQICMMAIFHELIEDDKEVFMDDFSILGSSYDHCLSNLDKKLTRCKETNLVLNWEKCHFMVKEGIILGHKISRVGIEVDREKIEAISKLPHPTNVKSIRKFDIEIRDKKGAENLAIDHISRLENHENEELNEAKIDNRFLDESIMKIDFGLEEPWFANFANYLTVKELPNDMIIRQCVFGREAKQILYHCHHGPAGGHHGAKATARKIFECGFYWPTVYKDGHEFVKALITEYLVNISKRRVFLSLNEDILKINDSDNQYVVSIKEDTAYPCLHSPKTTKETSSIRRIQRRPIRRIEDIVYWSDKEEKTVEILKIETDIFYYETPLRLAFNEFNYLLKVDSDILTKDIMGFKTYEDYKDDWIYEWNENVPWVYDKLWLDNGIWKELKPLHYQDLKWYEALEDSELKDEALMTKTIMEGLINDDESSNDCWKRWKSHEIYYHDYNEGEYENETQEEGHELCGPRERNIDEYWWRIYNSRDLEVMESGNIKAAVQHNLANKLNMENLPSKY